MREHKAGRFIYLDKDLIGWLLYDLLWIPGALYHVGGVQLGLPSLPFWWAPTLLGAQQA